MAVQDVLDAIPGQVISNRPVLLAVVLEVLRDNVGPFFALYQHGNPRALDKLLAECQRIARGRANPTVLKSLWQERLAACRQYMDDDDIRERRERES
jgi:Asp-tRNA(Asn)/Glu-tRNA(Gln) amidotransferase B subunit